MIGSIVVLIQKQNARIVLSFHFSRKYIYLFTLILKIKKQALIHWFNRKLCMGANRCFFVLFSPITPFYLFQLVIQQFWKLWDFELTTLDLSITIWHLYHFHFVLFVFATGKFAFFSFVFNSSPFFSEEKQINLNLD